MKALPVIHSLKKRLYHPIRLHRAAAAQARLKPWAEAVLKHPCTLTPLNGNDRPRLSFRIAGGGKTHIAHWASTASVARAFLSIGDYLQRIGLPVPDILHADPRTRYFLQEDLGSCTLASLSDSELHAGTYTKVATLLGEFQARGSGGFDRSWCCQPVYDTREFYLFTIRNFPGWLKSGVLSLSRKQRGAVLRDIETFCKDALLDAGGYRLNHTDPHLRNIIVKDGVFHLIDWDNSVPAPAGLDLAHFLTRVSSRNIWRYRDAVIESYLEAAEIPSAQRGLFMHQMQFMEACFLVRRLGLYARPSGIRRGRHMAPTLRGVFQREDMRRYPHLRDMMLTVTDLLE